MLSKFPNISFAFAYGSGVFNQGQWGMLDLMFAVNDPLNWHKENLKLNPQDYSALRYLGPNAICRIQNYGPGVYYNTYAKINNVECKYGVCSLESLKQDLREWNSLYFAGRMHKPTKILIPNDEVMELQQENLRNAVRVARLIGGDLLTTICRLSYLGDTRIMIENPNKIKNIVLNQKQELLEMYNFQLLETKEQMEKRIPIKGDLVKEIKRRVFKSSLQQSVKGLFTAGIKSIRYVLEKNNKVY